MSHCKGIKMKTLVPLGMVKTIDELLYSPKPFAFRGQSNGNVPFLFETNGAFISFNHIFFSA